MACQLNPRASTTTPFVSETSALLRSSERDLTRVDQGVQKQSTHCLRMGRVVFESCSRGSLMIAW